MKNLKVIILTIVLLIALFGSLYLAVNNPEIATMIMLLSVLILIIKVVYEVAKSILKP